MGLRQPPPQYGDASPPAEMKVRAWLAGKVTKYSQSADYVRTTDLAPNPSRPLHARLYCPVRVASAQTSGTTF